MAITISYPRTAAQRIARYVGLLILTLGLAQYAHSQQINIPYEKLSACQEKKFETFHTGALVPGSQTWKSIDDSRRLEYFGGTQALNTVEIATRPCMGLEQLSSIQEIHALEPDAASAEQFNLVVNWLPGGDKAFGSANGWSGHLAWLHPGQYGYQENREGNTFLGLVVLFNKDEPKVGQFHIGFRSGLSHYFADNGNIEKNYKRYRKWYGEIEGYLPPTSIETQRFDWSKDQVQSTPGLRSGSFRQTVHEFLENWYVQQNIDRLSQFVAQDNAVRALTIKGVLPQGALIAPWVDIFYRAFDSVGAIHIDALTEAIDYVEPSYSPSMAHLSYSNEKPSVDHFAIISPTSAAYFFPADNLTDSDLDSAAQFLRHLKRDYASEAVTQNRVQVVVYVTKGAGLVREACILYWINESGVWKLAAFQGTD